MCDPYSTWAHARKLLHQTDTTNMRHSREAMRKKTARVTTIDRERIEYVSAFFNEIRLTIDKSVCACVWILCVRYCGVDSCVWMINTEFFFPAVPDFPWKFVWLVGIFSLEFDSFSSFSSSFRFRLIISVRWAPFFSSWKFQILCRLKLFPPQNRKLILCPESISYFVYFNFAILDIASCRACAM